MDKLNQWVFENIGTWTFENFGLFFVLAVGLAILLILVLLIALVRHIKVKQKIKKLKAEAAAAHSAEQTSSIDEAALRAEIEESVRAELANEQQSAVYAQTESDADAQALYAQNAELSAKVEELDGSVREKQNIIDELTAELEAARSSGVNAGNDNAELSGKIDELERRVKEQENELNLLRAENSQIKAQAMQQQLAEQNAQKTTKSAAQSNGSVKLAAKAAAAKSAAKPAAKTAVPDEDDEYDEYYDDYGDETSAVKVTLKFDRTKNNWIILRSDSERTYRRMATKQEALVVAKDLARRLHAQLIVHKKDGKFQKI